MLGAPLFTSTGYRSPANRKTARASAPQWSSVSGTANPDWEVVMREYGRFHTCPSPSRKREITVSEPPWHGVFFAWSRRYSRSSAGAHWGVFWGLGCRGKCSSVTYARKSL